MRSLGGPMAMKWLSMHGDGHPNTTVMWSNNTAVHAHEAHHLVPLAKRWGWGSQFIELTLWNTSLVTITNAGVVAGFSAVVVGALMYFGYRWLKSGQAEGSTVQRGNNNKKRSNFEPNVYYSQAVTNQADTGQWPSGADIQNAIHAGLQDMADHDCE